MSAKPRIVFSTFRSSADPMFLSYARFNRVIGASVRRASPSDAVAAPALVLGAEPAPGAALCGVWRILATNNRELGRSARAYKSFEAARTHVLALQAAVDELVTTSVSGGVPGMHGWFMSLRSVPVLTCGRWYGSAASGFEASLALREALRGGELDVVARPVVPVRGGQAAPRELSW